MMTDVADQYLISDPGIERFFGPGPTVGEYADILERKAQFWDMINECRKLWDGSELTLGIFLGRPTDFFGGKSAIDLLHNREYNRVLEHLEARLHT